MSPLSPKILKAINTRPRWNDSTARWADVLTEVEAALSTLEPEAQAALLAEVEGAARGWSVAERFVPPAWESLERLEGGASALSLCRSWRLGEQTPSFKDPELFAALLQRPELAKVEQLTLSDVTPRAAHLDALAEHRASGLKVLVFRGCALGLSGARALCDRPGLFAGLEALELPGNKLNAAAAELLAQCPHLSGLTTLLLGENPIGVEGRIALGRSPHLSDAAKRSARAIASAQVELAPATQDAREVFGDLRSVLQQAPSAQGWARVCDMVARIEAERATHETLPYVEAGLSAWPAAQRPLMAAWQAQLELGEEVPPAARLARSLTLEGTGLNAKVAGRLGEFAAQAQIERLSLSGGNPSSKALRALLEAPGFTSLRELVYHYVLDEVTCDQLLTRGPHRLNRLEIGGLVHSDAAPALDGLLSSEATAELSAFGVEYGDVRNASLIQLREAHWWWGLRELWLGGGRWDGVMPLSAMLGGAGDPSWERLESLRVKQLSTLNAHQTPVEARGALDVDGLSARMPALRRFKLDCVVREDQVWRWLPALSEQLETLRLGRMPSEDPWILAQLDRASGGSIRELSVSFQTISYNIREQNAVALGMMRASCWRGLTRLRLMTLGMAEDQLCALLEVLPDTLESLELGEADLGERAARVMASRSWPALRELSCREMELTTSGMQILSGASWWGQLEALSLSQHDSVPQRLRGIEELMPGELRRLSLHGMGEAQLVQMLESGLPATLEALELRQMLASKGVAALVAALPGLSRLHTLDLEDNSVTAKGVAVLLASPQLLKIPLVKLGTNRLGRPGKQLVLDCPDASIGLKSWI